MALKVINSVEKKTLTGTIDGIDVVIEYESESGKAPQQISARATLNENGGALTIGWYAPNKNLSISTHNVDPVDVQMPVIEKIVAEITALLDV